MNLDQMVKLKTNKIFTKELEKKSKELELSQQKK
jgi:hypothetical protein